MNLKDSKKSFLLVMSAVSLLACSEQDNTNESTVSITQSKQTENKPNVVIFYVDDLGYGDVSSYGATSVQTPNVDALAADGIKFTDAHSPAATCTPSRYSMLTGQYAFRKKAAILPGDAPAIIDHTKPTLPKMFKRAGYQTAVVGKWHLGLGDGNIDWNAAVKPGPIELGFDYSFLLPATGDRVPTVYLENHHVVNLDPNDPIEVSYSAKIGSRPTGYENPELLKQQADSQHAKTIVNGISRIGFMKGGKSAEWVDEEFPFVFTDKAINFIDQNQDKPFMLFFPFNDIHVPRVPNPMFAGKTGMGPRGDAIAQMDWMTGKIVNHLKKLDLYENTIIIFSSDNGPVLDDGYADFAVEKLGDHDPAGGLTGGKYSAYEAGTRVPMIVTYPKGMKAKGESDAIISHVDFYRSIGSMLGLNFAADEAIDSENVMDALLNANADGREYLLEESFTFSLRKGNWKYIAPQTESTPDWLANKTVATGLMTSPQLFDLSTDPTEQNNLAEKNPVKLAELQTKLSKIFAQTKFAE